MRKAHRMLSLATLAAATAILFSAAPRVHAQALWYNGDFDGLNGLANESNTSVNDARVYDDFIVPVGPGWNVTSVFSNDLSSISTTTIDWEIRQGVSSGNGGTIVASGTGAGTSTATGRSGFGFTEIHYEIPVSLFLSPGTYWLMVRPVDSGAGRSFVSETSGANAVGSPAGNNYNSFFDSSFFGTNFQPAGIQTGGTPDFSLGVNGTVAGSSVPEPGTFALLGGLVVPASLLLRRRRA